MKIFAYGILLLTTLWIHGDTIVLNSGGTIEGIVLRESEDDVMIRLKHGTTTVAKSEILKIVKSTENPKAADAIAELNARIPDWQKCLTIVSKQKWAGQLAQIPATVIDNGALKNVPYVSFKSGDYEFNIYGNPDSPACIEIGIRNESLKNPVAKKNCSELLTALLTRSTERALLAAMDFKKDKKVLDDLTFEITPETDPDAYGGWWISIYCEKELEKSRASEKELADITVKRSDVTSIRTNATTSGDYAWSKRDLQFARPSPSESIKTPNTVDTSAGSGNYSGMVYVRAYRRKDGTYVDAYTRRAPSR